jgi:hypothetical protein
LLLSPQIILDITTKFFGMVVLNLLYDGSTLSGGGMLTGLSGSKIERTKVSPYPGYNDDGIF